MIFTKFFLVTVSVLHYVREREMKMGFVLVYSPGAEIHDSTGQATDLREWTAPRYPRTKWRYSCSPTELVHSWIFEGDKFSLSFKRISSLPLLPLLSFSSVTVSGLFSSGNNAGQYL